MDLVWDAIREAAGLIVRADAELIGIAGLSLVVSGLATALAALIGIPLGIALHIGNFRGRSLATLVMNAGMGLPPVVVGLVVTLVLWRTGPLGALRLLYTPSAMVLAQVLVALPLVAGVARTAISLLDADLRLAMRADGASETRIGRELAEAALPQMLVAVAAGFGRAISEVGASLMVGAGGLRGQRAARPGEPRPLDCRPNRGLELASSARARHRRRPCPRRERRAAGRTCPCRSRR